MKQLTKTCSVMKQQPQIATKRSQSSKRKLKELRSDVPEMASIPQTDDHKPYTITDVMCSTRVSSVLSSTRNACDSQCCSPSMELCNMDNCRNNDFVNISDISCINSLSDSCCSASSAFLSCYSEVCSETTFPYIYYSRNTTAVKNNSTGAIQQFNILDGLKNECPVCDGDETLPLYTSSKEGSSNASASYSTVCPSAGLTMKQSAHLHNMSVDSDRTEFMKAPLYTPGVTGQHISKEYSKNISKQLKRLRRHFQGTKKLKNHLKTLAVL